MWSAEDGGASRQAGDPRHWDVTGTPHSLSRLVIAATMVVAAGNRYYLIGHTAGEGATGFVEEFDPLTLEIRRRSPDLRGGPVWPGGGAIINSGDLVVVFGRHVHRLTTDLDVVQVGELPRDRPYNSFVELENGALVTKDFGGARPGEDVNFTSESCELLALDPVSLATVASVTIPDGSVARVSAIGNDVVVVGVQRLWVWSLTDEGFVEKLSVPYRRDGGGYGWDAVIADGRAWFLTNGAGSERYDGSLRGKGVATAGQEVVSVSLADGTLSRFLVHHESGGLVANPPAVIPQHELVVGYDSGNGVVTAFNYRQGNVAWSRPLNHGCHPMILNNGDLLVMNDWHVDAGHDDVVILDSRSGEELSRHHSDSIVQSVLFGAPGDHDDIYLCSFSHLSRLSWGDDER